MRPSVRHTSLFLAAASLLIAAGNSPAATANPAGWRPLVWVSLEDDGQVALVNVRTGKVLRRTSTPGGPHNITVAKDGTAVVALWGSDRIGIIGEGARFVTLGGAPHDVKIRWRTVLVANQGAARIDRVRLSARRLASIPLKTDPHDIAIAPDARHVWATLEGSDDMAIVDLRGGSVRYVSTGVQPHDLLFASGGRLWVTDWNGSLHVFDARRRIRTLRLGREAHHLAFSPDGKRVWVTDHGVGKVFVIRTFPVRLIKALDVPGEPHHVTITPNGAWAVVADHSRGNLVVYNADTYHRVRVIPVGRGPHGVCSVPA
jgi:DNA-binding beta-propeller fold protein YncE